MLISDSRSLPQPPACRDDLGHREILGVVDVQPFDTVYDSHVGFSPMRRPRPHQSVRGKMKNALVSI